MSATIVIGNLFDSKAKYIAHQCNCITTTGGHLAKDMFRRYPYADIYRTRTRVNNWRSTRDKPGTIIVRGNGADERYVINMIAQIFPGKSKYPNSKEDGFEDRTQYFNKCLNKIAKIDNLDSIAFPWGIGCGAAGNDWAKYTQMIDNFANYVDAEVYVIQLPE